MEAKERSWEFRWADHRDDHVIADQVVGELQKRLREFTPIAHSIMFSKRELDKVKNISDIVI